MLSFKEKDDLRRDATPLAKIPGLLDALLQVVGAIIIVYFCSNCSYQLIGAANGSVGFSILKFYLLMQVPTNI